MNIKHLFFLYVQHVQTNQSESILYFSKSFMNKKVILISGGTDGLGKALAEKFAIKHTVIIIGRDKKKTVSVARKIGCDYKVADVRDYSSLEKAVASLIKKHRHIDCLINSAGKWIEGPLEKNDSHDIQETIEVNTLGTIYLTKVVIPFMKKRRTGQILNVISTAALSAKAERSVYKASKWAINGFTQSIALELAPYKIRVSGFYPGAMKTDFFKKAGVSKDSSKHMDLEKVVKCVKFIVDSPEDLRVSDLVVRPFLNE